MGSKLRFGDILNSIKSVEREFLTKGVKLAQEEFKDNFESQSNKETGENWDELKYRSEPPPLLDLTGQLKDESINGVPIISGNIAILTINPIDDKGREYASYHEEGTDKMAKREFVTQSDDLTGKQINLLENLINSIF